MTVRPNTTENRKLQKHYRKLETPTNCICKIGGNTAPSLGNAFFITNK